MEKPRKHRARARIGETMDERETLPPQPAPSLAEAAHDSVVSMLLPGAEAPAPATGLLAHTRLLDSVAAFTHHRDVDALDHSLVLSLAELMSASRVSLAKWVVGENVLESVVECVPDHHGKYQVQVVELHLVEQDMLVRLDRCMEHMGVEEQVLPDGHRLIVPMLREGRAIAALEMDSTMAPAASRPLVDGFARIYANYTALLHESERDKLTGLYNRRSLERQLQRLMQQNEQARPPSKLLAPQRERRPLAGLGAQEVWLAILDIDHFKHVNDTYGHIYGDEVILLLAQQMRACFRRTDVLFRFGGEEFVILFAATDEATVKMVLERFRLKVFEYLFPQVGHITVSIGYAHVGSHDYPASVLDRADKALYFAKNHGRNSTHGYENLHATGELGQAVAAGTIDLF